MVNNQFTGSMCVMYVQLISACCALADIMHVNTSSILLCVEFSDPLGPRQTSNVSFAADSAVVYGFKMKVGTDFSAF